MSNFEDASLLAAVNHPDLGLCQSELDSFIDSIE